MKAIAVILVINCLIPILLANKFRWYEKEVLDPLRDHNCCVTFFSEKNYEGYYATFCENQPKLEVWGERDMIRSFAIDDGCWIETFSLYGFREPNDIPKIVRRDFEGGRIASFRLVRK